MLNYQCIPLLEILFPPSEDRESYGSHWTEVFLNTLKPACPLSLTGEGFLRPSKLPRRVSLASEVDLRPLKSPRQASLTVRGGCETLTKGSPGEGCSEGLCETFVTAQMCLTGQGPRSLHTGYNDEEEEEEYCERICDVHTPLE